MVAVGSLTVVLVIVLFLVKPIFFPISDSWFQLSSKQLAAVPANVLVVRPTHFQDSLKKGITYTPSGNVIRMEGRNVSLSDVISSAYQYRLPRIVLPADAPQCSFDFLVTVTNNPNEQLVAAIKKELGYSAHKETRPADVLLLKADTLNLSRLKPSPDDEKAGTRFQSGRLSYTHMPPGSVAGFLEWNLKKPVFDKTGITNVYDFNVNWDWHMDRGEFRVEDANKLLGGFGMHVEPGKESLEVLVVEKVK